MAPSRFVLTILLAFLHESVSQIYDCESSTSSDVCILRDVTIALPGDIDQIELPEAQQYVHFANGNIPSFAESIYGQLETTTNLTITGCAVKKLYVGAQLVHLNASGNDIQAIEIASGSDYSSLKVLDLSTNNLSRIPNVKDFVGLERLDLSGNKITFGKLDLFARLTKLKWLSLAGNEINSLVGGLQLRYLEELHLNGNKLLEVDFLNWQLRALVKLDLRDNLLMYLNAEDLESPFPKLARIDLSGNQWNCQGITKLVERLQKRAISFQPAPTTSKCPTTSIQGVCCEDSYVNSVTLQSQWDIRKLQRQMQTMNDTLVAKLAAVRLEQGVQIEQLERQLTVQEGQMGEMKLHLLRMARLIEDLIEELYLRQMEGVAEAKDEKRRGAKRQLKIVF
ncbi:leucine-rich repeat-containing G-protein coupled receptor 5-like [Culex pipiens pallens]|uniref:leucine-rich repeat-containing G-protein coupled receptor 5-like n=1 Tax=Culex pipiens pallens TaxID=42434 RepID=UPI00195385DB|nr:leucine-rich repeat-containing G-protein coupled receptor 5-like [Culex pipiens pallens]